MKSRLRFELSLAMLLLVFAWAANSAAQAPDSQGPDAPDPAVSYPSADPGAGQASTDPSGRVARIQYMTGEVSIQPGGVNDWIAANLNRPLTTSDRVWTDKNSKAELNVGGGFVRLDSETSVTLTNVTDNTVQVELDQGTVELTVGYLAAGQVYEVDTPNMAFTVSKTGVYKFNVYPNEDQTWVTVRKGQGEATGRGSAVKVKSGEQVRFSGGTSMAHTSEPAPAPDGFDDWASVRDKRLENSESARYVSPGVIGYQDLDAYGHWQTVAPYGAIWVPSSVPVGWAPYRYGHWAYIAPWGWTWVDDAAWGFAPFHYGRWVYTSGYWGWAPGPYRSWSPCYAPALVGWVGGPGWGVGIGFGGMGWGVGINFGWFPLGWGEPYYPWYHGWHGHGLSATYVRNVNVTNTYIHNTTYITKNYYGNTYANTRYVNRNVNGAVTAAPQSAIAGGRPISRYGATVSQSQLMHAPAVRGIEASPTRASMLGGQATRSNGVPPSGTFNHSVVTRATPPQAATEARLNAPRNVAVPNSSTSPSAARTPNSTASAQAGNGHYVPRPPSAGGTVTANGTAAVNGTSSASTHNVPRPPQNTGGYANGASHTATAPNNGNSNAAHRSDSARAVSPAPSAGQAQRGPGGTMSAGPVQHGPGATPSGASPAAHGNAPANSHPATPHESGPSHAAKPESNAGHSNFTTASSVPRPPTNYTYRAAPVYRASATSSGAAYGRGNNFAGGSYSAAPNYNAHGSNSTAPPRYGSSSSSSAGHTGSYASPQSYATQRSTPYMPPSSSSAGHASAQTGRSGAHYSTPSAGGGAHYSAPSGGGASHGSSGGHSR